jgi:hypothetical protein
MKVPGDSASLAALNPLLGGPEHDASASVSGDAPLAMPGTPAAPTRDRAEEYLDLNVWGAASAAARQLHTTAPAPSTAGMPSAAAAQAWADHMFKPLSHVGESFGG